MTILRSGLNVGWTRGPWATLVFENPDTWIAVTWRWRWKFWRFGRWRDSVILRARADYQNVCGEDIYLSAVPLRYVKENDPLDRYRKR